jgi:hypothetical protein
MTMRSWRWPLIGLVVLLTASDCNGEVTRPLPSAEYRALLQATSAGGLARGVASAILYSNGQLVVNGTYQDLTPTVGQVRLTTDADGLSWCRLDHAATSVGQGTFSGTCSFAALVSELDGNRAWVYVYDDSPGNEVLGGRFNLVRRY